MNKHFITTVLLATAMPAAIYAENESKEPVDTAKVIELQDVQVVSTRAQRRTPMAYTNMDKEQVKLLNKGKDTVSNYVERRWHWHRIHGTPRAWH